MERSSGGEEELAIISIHVEIMAMFQLVSLQGVIYIGNKIAAMTFPCCIQIMDIILYIHISTITIHQKHTLHKMAHDSSLDEFTCYIQVA